jgi:TonB-linked SusC/RagA family outer membrane protein
LPLPAQAIIKLNALFIKFFYESNLPYFNYKFSRILNLNDCFMKKSFLVFLCFLSGILSAYAQNKINGKITSSEDQEAIRGATVTIKGTNIAAMTDRLGNFTIQNAPSKSTLVISSVGYDTQEILVGSNSVFNIQLKVSAKQLKDVIVTTALGIQREERSLGYSVSEVKGDELIKARELNVVNSLEGRVAGLVVTGTAGGPAGSSRVIIRGNTSLTGNNQPLYVIDGVPMDNSNYGGVGSSKNSEGYDMGDAISTINPDDVEKITVLKGPSAAALYGSGAANGVIMITTRKGTSKNLGIEFNSTSSIETQLTHFDDYQYLYGHGTMGTLPTDSISSITTLFKNFGARLDPNLMVIGIDGKKHPYGLVKNNIDNFFQTGNTFTNNISLTQSVNNTSFRLSVSDVRNKDIVPKSGLNRTTISFAGRSKFGTKLTLNVTGSYMNEEVNNRPAQGQSNSNIGTNFIGLGNDINQAMFKTNYKTTDGSYLDWGQGVYNLNPYWIINEMWNKTHKQQLNGNVTANYDFSKWLSIQGRVAGFQTLVGFQKYSPVTTPLQESGELLENDMKYTTLQSDVMVTIKKDLSSSVNLTARIGASTTENKSQGNSMRFTDMQVDVVTANSFASKAVQELNVQRVKNSVYGLLTASYKRFLYLDATVRQDMSSTLPKNNTTYVYPSLSGSFIYTDAFRLPKIISFGKIRASAAEVGSDADPYMLNLYYNLNPFLFDGKSFGSISSRTVPNKNLKPTRTRSFEVGTEAKFLDNRFGFEFTYYTQKSRDQIIVVPRPYSSGFFQEIINAGLITNRGVEVSLNSSIIREKNVSWDLNVNFARNVNEVVSLAPGSTNISLADARWLGVSVVAMPGEPYGAILGYDYQRDSLGRVILNPVTLTPLQTADRKVLGKGTYDWTGGISNTIRYKELSLNFLIDVKQGAQLFSMTNMLSVANGKNVATLPGRDEWIKSEEARLAAGQTAAQWKAAGNVRGYVPQGVVKTTDPNGKTIYVPNTQAVDPSVYWPTFSADGNGVATPFVYNASYIKMREITLSYGLPRKITNKLGLTNLTVAIVSRNPFIISKNVPNVDPDSNYQNGNGQGLEYGSLPSRRSWGFNLNVKF